MKVTLKYLLVALLACSAGAVQANHNDYANESRDCCFSSCYECGCNPLYCGAWDLQIQGGVNPITWRNRGDLLAVNCGLDVPVVNNGQLLKFKHFYKTPWIVGGQIGYHWSDNVRAYVEFNYSQAKARTVDVAATVPDIVLEFTTLGKYKVFDAYVGTRYYCDRWCDRVAFFLGAKVGLTHHKSDSSNLTIQTPNVNPPVIIATDAVVFASNTVVSGGADFGFDVCFCGNWSLVITGSVLASCGPRNTQVLTTVNTPVSNLFLAGIGSELRFPVTAGVRYSF
ncbi:hypothetical protein BH09DEP1_BH09DEP1_2780 [soil metagenome]